MKNYWKLVRAPPFTHTMFRYLLKRAITFWTDRYLIFVIFSKMWARKVDLPKICVRIIDKEINLKRVNNESLKAVSIAHISHNHFGLFWLIWATLCFALPQLLSLKSVFSNLYLSVWVGSAEDKPTVSSGSKNILHSVIKISCTFKTRNVYNVNAHHDNLQLIGRRLGLNSKNCRDRWFLPLMCFFSPFLPWGLSR